MVRESVVHENRLIRRLSEKKKKTSTVPPSFFRGFVFWISPHLGGPRVLGVTERGRRRSCLAAKSRFPGLHVARKSGVTPWRDHGQG